MAVYSFSPIRLHIFHILLDKSISHSLGKEKGFKQLPRSSWPRASICIGCSAASCLRMDYTYICILRCSKSHLYAIYENNAQTTSTKISMCCCFSCEGKACSNSQFAAPKTGTKHYNSQSRNKKANLAFKEHVGRKIITAMFGICREIFALALNTVQRETQSILKLLFSSSLNFKGLLHGF